MYSFFLNELIFLLKTGDFISKTSKSANKLAFFAVEKNREPNYYVKILKGLFSNKKLTFDDQLNQLKKIKTIVDLILSSSQCTQFKECIMTFKEKLEIILVIFDLINFIFIKTNLMLFQGVSSNSSIDPNKNLILAQDYGLNYYRKKLAKILIYIPNMSEWPIMEANYIQWQTRQFYRLINTMLASYHPDLLDFKDKLKQIRLKLRNRSYLKQWIEDIEGSPSSRPLVCSGHGIWFEKNGEIELATLNNQIIFYSPWGALLYNQLGILIESDRYDFKKVSIDINHKGGRRKLGLQGRNKLNDLFIYDNQSTEKTIPNFSFTLKKRDTLSSKIICMKTGEVLFDLKEENINSILLQDILNLFSDYPLHWAACTAFSAEEPIYHYSKSDFKP